MTNNIDLQSFGRGGVVVVTNAAAAAGKYCQIQFVTSGTITSLTSDLVTGTITGITFPAGFTIRVPFTGVTVTGSVILTNAVH
jgi:hypothetical protein